MHDYIYLNKFEKWLLRRLLKKIMIQGDQTTKVVSLFTEIRKAAENEFSEDNDVTLRSWLLECFNHAVPNPYRGALPIKYRRKK